MKQSNPLINIFDLPIYKDEVFEKVSRFLGDLDIKIVSKDENRPWGGFFVLDETQAIQFANIFFSEVDKVSLKLSNKISPKILIVAPQKRLSWQYHFRRSELWKLIGGEAGVKTSDNDIEGSLQALKLNDLVTLRQGERHRLVGLNGWGIIAEIWQHTDSENPSDEDDIVRLQDDFGR